ncbi:hypothetical protein LR48_Vigan05g106500 [Vigna angularis]|uniref:Uncharacterized protein n=1 Tax=Phaseolus angularis TaxID=3914 RepID=A0A0L9ULA8_PHAAN|nr:hypothetical protein LR48_Vigan05g106500 [Vigna angularis]
MIGMLKSQPETRKSTNQPEKSTINQNAEKSTRMQKKCDRVALSGNVALSGSFQVPKPLLRGKTVAGGKMDHALVPLSAYYRQYCGGDEAAQPVLPRHPRRGRGQSQELAQPHDADPFQMRDMYMSLIDARMQSIHRGQVATIEMIIGIGPRAAKAPSMDDDEDDDDEFEDAEDEGEQEDSDDSMG